MTLFCILDFWAATVFPLFSFFFGPLHHFLLPSPFFEMTML